MDRRLPGDLPRLRGPSATVVTDMPCRLDGEPAPTPGSVTVLPAAWRVLAPV
jgi:diacylglycerol kinase family enzyme